MQFETCYRYSLQFPRGSMRNERIGALLEACGYHKSSLILEALDEYTRAHPEILTRFSALNSEHQGGGSNADTF